MLDPIELEALEGRIPAELVYLAKYSAYSGVAPSDLRALGYLHKTKAPIWQGRLTEQERREYEQQLPSLARAFAVALPDRPFAALVAAPSSRPDLVCPFAEAVRQRFPQVCDLTPFVRREGNVRSGNGASFDEILQATRFDVPPSVLVEGASLVVDDVFSTGRTAAVLAHLFRHRFGDVPIVVACPLRTVSGKASFKAPTLDELRIMMTPEMGGVAQKAK